jgi:hypothetical protein
MLATMEDFCKKCRDIVDIHHTMIRIITPIKSHYFCWDCWLIVRPRFVRIFKSRWMSKNLPAVPAA